MVPFGPLGVVSSFFFDRVSLEVVIMALKKSSLVSSILVFVLLVTSFATAQAQDSLQSWENGKAKQSIINFV